MKKKILVIFTGGTISSQLQENDKIAVSKKVVWQLVDEYEKENKESIDFTVRQPFTMLSENCVPDNWKQLVQALEEEDLKKYDGVIVTHGTDTFIYTGALLSYLYGDISIPLILIGSNFPLADKRSNGRANFRGAVQLICQKKWRGVFAIFQNKQGESRVYLPTRMIEADAYEDEFSSFGGGCLGVVTEEGFIYDEKNPVNPKKEAFLQSETRTIVPKKTEYGTSDILTVYPHPGMNYEAVSLAEKPAAVLHGLYHSATACITGGKYSCLDFLEKCREEDIPVYAASVKPGEKQYETGNTFLSAGAIPLYNITMASAYMKLYLAYGQENLDEPSRRKLLTENWYYENLP